MVDRRQLLRVLVHRGVGGPVCAVHGSTWETDEPTTKELYDVGRHVSYRVCEDSTPDRAAAMLEEHGETPEEE